MTDIKITVVGDGSVGKTCLLSTYTKGVFPGDYVPTVFEQYAPKISVDNIEYNMTLWDMAGQEDYERLRPLSYHNTNCFLVCYSVDRNLDSYDNVSSIWVPEVRHFYAKTPLVLVATQIDLRDDPSIKCYTPEDGGRLKRKVKAQSFKECSALLNVGLEDIFLDAVRVVNKHKVKRPTPVCNML